MTGAFEFDKTTLRAKMRRLLREVEAPARLAESRRLEVRVIGLREWRDATRPLLYWPLPDEIDVRGLMTDACCVPRIASLDPPTMIAVAHTRAVQTGPFGISEPAGPGIDPLTLDFALIPGLAFTRDGKRLGRGKGFYDRFLAQLRPECFKCGVGYDLQLLDDLPTEPHDMLLDAVVTPSGVYRRTNSPFGG